MKHPKAAVLGLAATIAVLAAGCGGDKAATVGTADHGHNVDVAIDYTTAKSSPTIAAKFKAALGRYADPVLKGGGYLRVAIFAGAGVAPAIVIDQDVPTTEELTGNRRKRFLIAARVDLATLLDQALGLKPVPSGSPLASQLADMRGDGSDVAGAIYQETALLKQRGGGSLHVLSDGLQRSQGLDFSATIEEMSVAQAAEALKQVMPANASGVSIDIDGAGLSGNKVNVSTPRSRKLTEVWTLACRTAKAAACSVHTAI